MIFSPEILLDFVSHCFAVRLRLRSAQDDTARFRFAGEYVFHLHSAYKEKRTESVKTFSVLFLLDLKTVLKGTAHTAWIFLFYENMRAV